MNVNLTTQTRLWIGIFALLAGLSTNVPAQEIMSSKDYKPIELVRDEKLSSVLKSAIDGTLEEYKSKGLKDTEIAATIIDLSTPGRAAAASYRGDSRIYPASVVKMFFMAALQQQIQDGKLKVTPELNRGERDMIVDSSNEATQYILDVLTDTSSGAEKPQKEFEEWQYKRDRVNRYFSGMGYTNINVNQKTFCEDAYGIEQQSRGYKGQNRNMLTTDATARLLAEIALGRSVDSERSAAMMTLMKRDPFAAGADPDSQAVAFTGKVFIDRKMTDAKLWSKAGWTSSTRHDAAYIETADGKKVVIVVFTEKRSNERGIIPAIASRVLDGISAVK